MAATEEKLQNVLVKKAYKSEDFLTSPAARHIRVMCELHEPMQRLQKNNVENVVLFVGSHLMMHPDDRSKQIADIELKLKGGGPRDESEALNARLRFAKKMVPMDRFYSVALELGGKIATWNKERVAAGKTQYNVLTGGGPGVMEAANRGAHQAGEVTLGFGSTRPEWGQMNQYVTEDGAFEFHYFFMRKFWMAYKCMGLIVLPGGYGTLDELFEILSLMSAKRINHRLPVILVGKEHWQKVVNWEYLVETQMLSQQHYDMVTFMDTADEAFNFLKDQIEAADRLGENEGHIDGVKRRRTLNRKHTGSDPPAAGQ